MIKRVHDASFDLYDTRKVWHQLRREGVAVAKCTVERLMRTSGLAGVGRARRPSRPSAIPRRRVSRFNALWAVDFTYVHAWAGFVYVALVSPPFVS